LKRALIILLVGWFEVGCGSDASLDPPAMDCAPDLSLYDQGFPKPTPSSVPRPFETSELPGFSISLQIRAPASASAGQANLSYWMSGTDDLDYDVLLRWGTGTPSQGSEIALLLFIDGNLISFAVEGSTAPIFRRMMTPGGSAELKVHVPSAQIADGAHLVALVAFPMSGGGMLHALVMNALYKNSTAFDRPSPIAVQTLARFADRSSRGLVDPTTGIAAPLLDTSPSADGDLPLTISWETTATFASCPTARQDVLFAAILDFDRQVELGDLGLAPRVTLVGAERVLASTVLHGLPVQDGKGHQLWFLAFSGYGHHFEVPWGVPTIWARDGITGKVGLIRW
jgi:hypothetical protein